MQEQDYYRTQESPFDYYICQISSNLCYNYKQYNRIVTQLKKIKMDEEIYDMKIQETQVKMSKAKLTQKYHPGFACFFENYLKAASISFKQCYERLITSQHQIQIISNPIKNILKMNNDNQQQTRQLKHQSLIQRSTIGQHFLHFAPNLQDQNKIDMNIIDYSNKQEEQTWKLQLKLKEYRRIKDSLIKNKYNEFQEARRQQQQRKQRIRLQQQRLKALKAEQIKRKQ